MWTLSSRSARRPDWGRRLIRSPSMTTVIRPRSAKTSTPRAVRRKLSVPSRAAARERSPLHVLDGPPQGHELLPPGQQPASLPLGDVPAGDQPLHQLQALPLPDAGAQGGAQVHHLQLHGAGTTELVDLQVKRRIHP